MVSKTELRPCPHCASEALGYVFHEFDNHDEFAVTCYNCGATGPYEMSEASALLLWNLRRPMEAREKEINAGWNDIALELKHKISNLEAERQDVVRLLREICAEYGDNDWPDNLHLYDVIEKHLWRHLEPGEDGEQ